MGSSMGACLRIHIFDLSLVVYRCTFDCIQCSAYNYCTLCGIIRINTDDYQGYLSADNSQCQVNCSISFYANTTLNIYQCDVCHVSCRNCS